MKKLLKILILILGLTPLLINAQEKEVNYKWYKEVEDNIRYTSEVENICEYFDKNSYITSDWYYSLTKPEEKDYRIVEETNLNFDFSRLYSKYLDFKYFPMHGLKIYELEFFDEENKKIEYTVKQEILNEKDTTILKDNNYDDSLIVYTYDVIGIILEKVTNIPKMKIIIHHEKNEDFKDMFIATYAVSEFFLNAYADYEEIVETNCEGNMCITEISINQERILTNPIPLSTKGYKYKDKLYKCYDSKIEYAPGYHKDLSNEGYIKDETDYIEVEKIDNMCPIVEKQECNCPQVETQDNCSRVDIPNIISPIINESNTVENQEIENFNEPKDEPITENITNKIENNHELIKDKVAMVTKEKSKDKVPTYMIFLTVFCILSIILTIILIAKKIKKCRMK